MNGRPTSAEEDLRTAVRHADNLVVPRGTPPDKERSKASAMINLSEVLMLKNQNQEAHQVAGQAFDLLRSIIDSPQSPDREPRDQWFLSMAITDRGVACKKAGNHDQAIQDLEEAARVARELSRHELYHDDAQFQLATIANQKGELLSHDRTRHDESDHCFEEASAILSTLITNHKLIPHYRGGTGRYTAGKGRPAVGAEPPFGRITRLPGLLWGTSTGCRLNRRGKARLTIRSI